MRHYLNARPAAETRSLRAVRCEAKDNDRTRNYAARAARNIKCFKLCEIINKHHHDVVSSASPREINCDGTSIIMTLDCDSTPKNCAVLN
jgi:hypothetical protein